jgi:hypothetical protein
MSPESFGGRYQNENMVEILAGPFLASQELIFIAMIFFGSDRLKNQKLTFFCPVFETIEGF